MQVIIIIRSWLCKERLHSRLSITSAGFYIIRGPIKPSVINVSVFFQATSGYQHQLASESWKQSTSSM